MGWTVGFDILMLDQLCMMKRIYDGLFKNGLVDSDSNRSDEEL